MSQSTQEKSLAEAELPVAMTEALVTAPLDAPQESQPDSSHESQSESESGYQSEPQAQTRIAEREVCAPVAAEPMAGDQGKAELSAAATAGNLEKAELSPEAMEQLSAGSADNLLPETGTLEFDALSRVKELAIQRLQKGRKSIFAYLLLFLLGFKIIFGTMALTTLLIWCTILFVLTKLHRLNARFVVSVEESGISVSRRHWLGQEVLKLSWNMIDSVARPNLEGLKTDELRIKLKQGAISRFQSMVFEDILEPGNIISIRPGPGAKTEQAVEECAAESIAAEHLHKTKDFFLRLSQFCPQDLFACRELALLNSPEEPSKSPLLGEETGFVVPYLPISQFQKKCSKVLKSSEKYLMIPLGLSALASLLFLGAQSSISILIGLFVPLLMLVFATKEATHSLLFTPDGITVVWTAFGSTQRSKPISWDSVEYVSHHVQFGKKRANRDKIEFRLNSAAPDIKHVKILQEKHMSVGLFRQDGDKSVLSLDTRGLLDPVAKQDLLAAIKRYMPEEQIDSSVREALNPTDLASYTQLWLDSLGNESSRRSDVQLSAGQHLRNGSFEIIDFLGAGGQASVYLARSLAEAAQDGAEASRTEKPPENTIVLKEFILPSHAGADLSVRSLNNIQKELDLMKRLQHPNIVLYHDIFVEDHRCYLVLEHVNGKSLRAIVEESGPLSEEQVLGLALQMAEILQHMHSQTPAVVHRDFTPENLILAENGVLKLIDFNVAQELEESAIRTIVGKHSYLPPEQFRGKACPQSDIYALGATLHFLLTGDEPEPITCSHPILKDESISAELDALVAHATALELENRFLNAGELLRELSGLQAKDKDD